MFQVMHEDGLSYHCGTGLNGPPACNHLVVSKICDITQEHRVRSNREDVHYKSKGKRVNLFQ